MTDSVRAATDAEVRVPRRRRIATIALVVSIVIALVMWAACVTSYFVEWSTFTKGPERPRDPTLPPMPAIAVSRDETHYMFGHGRVAILNDIVATESFQPNADLISWHMAWATADATFKGICHCEWGTLGPRFAVQTWVLASICTLPVLVLVLLRRPVPAGHCPKCRYDLRGICSERCPECGHAQSLVAPNSVDATAV